MIDLTLALKLRAAGLNWRPANGDRFVVTNTELVDETFHLADMVIEARELSTGTIFAFNGTTEWALDSIDQEHTVWLPREHQLRERLGTAFRSLSATDAGFLVSTSHGDFEASDAENAYGTALLALLST